MFSNGPFVRSSSSVALPLILQELLRLTSMITKDELTTLRDRREDLRDNKSWCMSFQHHQHVDSPSKSRLCAYLILGTPKHPLSAYVSRPPFSTPIICGKRTKHICLPYSAARTSRSFVATLPENIQCYQNYKEPKGQIIIILLL